jgi:PAS domain S-box-containing protein
LLKLIESEIYLQKSKKQIQINFFILGIGLSLSYIFLRGSSYQGSATLHTIMESLATLLAFITGIMALLRYYSKKNDLFLIIGAGFIGTAMLDGYHAIVTSVFLKGMLPSDLDHLIPWSWVASRFYLSIIMFYCWWTWYKNRERNISAQKVYWATTVFTLASFIFFVFFPLPLAYYPDIIFHRPEEFVPAIFFLFALIGFYKKGAWQNNIFEKWLIYSLIVNFISQAVFMSFSGTLFDLEFDAAHTLKKVSYVLVLTGLLRSMYLSFKQVEEEISEREQAEYNLMNYKNALDASAIISKTDSKGIIKHVNDMFCQISEYSKEELIGSDHRIINSSYHSRDFWIDFWGTIKRGNVWRGELRNKKKGDAGYYWVDTTIYPIKSDQGEITNFLAFRYDITERKKIEAEREEVFEMMKSSKQEAEYANKAKSEFLANMSHEIRTPLNAIIGFSQMLFQESTEGTSSRKYLKTIVSSGNSLLGLINDILDLAKIESGKMTIVPEAIKIRNLLNDIISIFERSASEKNLTLSLIIEDVIPKVIIIDEIRTRQILVNLIGNAIKFTDKGSVELNVICGNSRNNGDYFNLSFCVRDTGTGIAEDKQELIFESFRQTDSQRTKELGGTGLGLAISKKLALAMGGDIELESEIGKGSCFKLKLNDVEKSRTNLDVDENKSDVDLNIVFSGEKILIVDDIENNRLLLGEFLSNKNLKIYEAKNGIEAVEIARSTMPNLILMDQKMPLRNGDEAATILKDDTLTSHIPILCLTASLQIPLKVKRDDLFLDYIFKPIDLNTLVQSIQEILNPSESVSSGSLNGEEHDIITKIKLLPIYTEINKKFQSDFIQAINNLDTGHLKNLIDSLGEYSDEVLIKELCEKLINHINDFELEELKESINDLFLQ